MKQILGIDGENFNPKESLTGCHHSETLADESYAPLGFETNDSTVGAKTDCLAGDRAPKASILGVSQLDGEDLSEIGQEADRSGEIHRFVTDLLCEPPVPDANFQTLFEL
ncbi:MAG TPA: hypothetical protein IGS17_18420 [Oscillatoriales cyanobacterium M59_W2019_021]|nr:MAG: hypothetical protein D6728_11920 [Cyanobacteria bacterium J055]HIK32421.1 hypothetical protein [Oscillatoriales cyanobacterium M4454_W2019_049]HIK52877.1 hypothetical protein [Oscillatoriales cyanobacterium M59_W2019_021]